MATKDDILNPKPIQAKVDGVAPVKPKPLDHPNAIKGTTEQFTPTQPKPLNLPPTKVTTNTELFHALNPEMPKSAEQLAVDEKKKKRDELFAKIGDGISAISNLYFTSQYAPDMTQKQSAQERVQLKWDKIRNDDDAKRANYYNQLLRARAADDARAMQDCDWKRQLQLDDDKRKQDALKAEKDKKLHDINLLIAQGKLGEQDAKRLKAQIEADYSADVQKSIIGRNKAAANASNASAKASSARAESYDLKEFVAYDKYGNIHYFKDGDAAHEFAMQEGTYVPHEIEEVHTDTEQIGDMTNTTTKKVTKPSGGYSQKPKKANPMSGKKKNPMQ